MKDPKSPLIIVLALLLIASATVNAILLWPDYRYRRIVERSDSNLVPGTLRGIETRLHRAVLRGDADQVTRLLADEVDPNQCAEWCGRSTGWVYTPALLLAVEQGDIRMMEQLLSLGADLNARQWPDGDSALHVAVQSGQDATVAWLLERMNPNTDNYVGSTPLHDAALSGRALFNIRTLLDAGADPLLRDSRCETPFDAAISHNRPVAAGALMQDPRVAASIDLDKLLASVESRKYTKRLAEEIRTWIELRRNDQDAGPAPAPSIEGPPEPAGQ